MIDVLDLTVLAVVKHYLLRITVTRLFVKPATLSVITHVLKITQNNMIANSRTGPIANCSRRPNKRTGKGSRSHN